MTNEIQKPTLLSVEDTAEYLDLSIPTIRNWRLNKKLPFYQVGKSIKFKKEDLDAFLERSFTPARS